MNGGSLADDSQLAQRLADALPATVWQWLMLAVQIATQRGTPLYVVGGPVRDLLLQRPITDLDVVVEQDAWPVAEAFCAALGAQITKHAAFRTAAVALPHADSTFTIDFVTARREVYPTPAALPVVTPSHIADDLARRDFTINTLALRCAEPGTAALLDPFAGEQDLQAKLVRVLHAASFWDDPTRMVRATRFAARLHFAIEPQTWAWLRAAVGDRMIERTSAQRILNELWLLLGEPQPEAVLALLHAAGALPQLLITWGETWISRFPAARAAEWADVAITDLYLGLVICAMDQAQRTAFGTRYNLPAAQRRLLREIPGVPLQAMDRPGVDAAELEQLLHAFSAATLRVHQLTAPAPIADHIARYLDTIRPLPPLLSGADLQAQGVKPGPIFRDLLAAVRREQLRGTITTREAALRWLAARRVD